MNDPAELDALRDPVLRRALDNAPDRAAEPSHEIRRRIQRAAHRAVEAEPEDIDLDESIWRIWWRRLRGDGRMPWRSAFATLLVAGIVTLLWQREPVPEARLDSDKSTAASPAPAPPSPPPAALESPAAPPPEPATAAPPAPAAPGRAAEMPSVPAEPPAGGVPPSTAAPPPAAPATGGAPPAGAVAPLERQQAQPPARPDQGAARGATDELPADEVRESESKAKAAAAPPPPAAAPPPPAAAPMPRPGPPPPLPAPAAPATPAGEAAAPGTGATDRRAAAPQRAAPPATRSEGTEPPSFAALSQWRRITILRTDGASRNLGREEVGELVPLLGSAALVAVTAQPLPDAVEWRVVLERANGDRLAVLDIAGNWVRWREGRAPPGTGAPSAGALAALRDALRDALER